MSGKARTQRIVIGAGQRILAQQIDVIGNQNQLPRLETPDSRRRPRWSAH